MTRPLRRSAKESGTAPVAARRAEAARSWRWFLGKPLDPEAALRLRRLPVVLPSTKDIAQHPLYGGALLRLLWRIGSYRLTRGARWLLVLTFLLGFFGAVSLDIQIYVPFLYTVALWGVAILGMAFAYPRATLRVRAASRVSAGQTLHVAIDVTQEGRLPGLDLNVIAHELPLDVDAAESEGVSVGPLLAGQTVTVALGLRCPRRGVYTIGGWRVESDFPFGLINTYHIVRENRAVTVLPEYRPLTRLEVPTGRRYQPGGIQLASKVGDSFEYFGNREFREGDNVRDIDWRATARMGGTLVLREWREEYFLRTAVILDTFVPLPKNTILQAMPTLSTLFPSGNEARRQHEVRLDDFERAVSLAAAITDYMAGQEYVVDLFAAGPALYYLQSGRGLATRDQVLDILSEVPPRSSDSLTALLPRLEEDIARLTSVICVFLDWNDARRDFAERLREAGCGVKVIVARTGPPTLNPDLDPYFGESAVVVDAAAAATGVDML